MTEQWQELKETITEMRDNDGTGTQQDVCKFLVDYMEMLEKQMQQPCEDAVSRSELLSHDFIITAQNGISHRVIYATRVEEAPPVTPQIEPSEDCISRTEAIEKTIDAVDEWDGGCNKRRAEMIEKALKNLPPVKPTSEDIKEAYLKGYDYGVKDWFKSKTQLCEDCISRTEAIDKLTKFYNMVLDDNGTKLNIRDIVGTLERLPSVTPKYTDEEIDKAQAVEQAYVDKMVELAVEEAKRPKGKWIHIYKSDIACECSVCHIQMPITEYYHYCPNCGAEMGGADETN